jgi:hypothetical protein
VATMQRWQRWQRYHDATKTKKTKRYSYAAIIIKSVRALSVQHQKPAAVH